MSIRVLIFSGLVLFAKVQAQIPPLNSTKVPLRLNQQQREEQPKSFLYRFVGLVRGEEAGRIHQCLSDNVDTSDVGIAVPIPESLANLIVDSVIIESEQKRAKITCLVSCPPSFSFRNEELTIVQSTNGWQVAKSKLLVKLINSVMSGRKAELKKPLRSAALRTLPMATRDGKNPTTISASLITVPSFTMSQSALIQRTAWWTSADVINRSITQEYVGRMLFDDPIDGKVVLMNGTADAFSVISDHLWDRIVFASHNGGWTKSYGDNPGEHSFHWPTSVGLDKYGNIFLLANVPRTVVRLRYDEAPATVTYVQELSLPGVSEPVDLYMDWNYTPNTIADDVLWIADRAGNAVFRFDWNGQQLGKYTRVIDAYTGVQLDFVHPTKVIANYGGGYGYNDLALIDADRKRVIIIDHITNFQGDAIIGYYTATQFSSATNASLNSLGEFGLNTDGLWVADISNGVFHILDQVYGKGYLGSIQMINGGPTQWISPKMLVSTKASNSEDFYYDGMTLDQWDDTHGINTYLNGSDLLDPKAVYNSSDIWIYASLTNDCYITAEDLYKEDGTFIRSLSGTFSAATRTVVADVYNNQLPSQIGKYRIHAQLKPYAWTDYGDWYTGPVHRDIWFAPRPLGTLTGPTCGMSGANLSWNVSMTSGSGVFAYKWYRQDFGNSTWIELTGYTGPSCTQQMGSRSFTTRCDITDSFDNNVLSLSQYVSSITTSGSLVSNEIWSGTITLTGSVTIPSGLSLTIQPGTTIRFPSAASLIANGILAANGQSGSLITCTSTGGTNPGSWGSIVISGSGASGSVLNYCSIRYATQVQANNNASNITVSHCNIDTSTYGIDYNASTGSILNSRVTSTNIYHGIVIENASSVTCKQNVVTKMSSGYHQGAGILFGSSGGRAWQNDISGWNWGVGAIWGASPHFRSDSNSNRNNRIRNCLYGVMAYNNSWPVICPPPPPPPMNYYVCNSIYDNSTAVYFTSGGTLYADFTYWGSNPVFYYPSGSTVVHDYSLGTDPWQGFGGSAVSPAPLAANSSDLQETFDKSTGGGGFWDGIELRNQGKYVEAKDFFISYLAKNPKDQAAYVELFNCYNDATASDIVGFFESLPSVAAKEHRLLLSLLYLKQKNIQGAKRNNISLMAQFPNTSMALRAMLNNFYIMLYSEGDFASALTTLKDAQNRASLSTPTELSLAQVALATFVDSKSGEMPMLKLQQSGDQSIRQLPLSDGITGNYPNPFNPSTQITYQLESDAIVSLMVYDLLGREVVTLAKGMKPPGYYTEVFDGSKLASGVYYARLLVDHLNGKNAFIQTRKILLMK